MIMSSAILSQEEYLTERKRQMRRHRGMARAQLASARAEHAVRPTPTTRSTLVRCQANLFIAQAFCEALEDVK